MNNINKEKSFNIEQYFEKLDLTEEFLSNKKILDMGCRDGEFVKYLSDKNITSNAYGLDIRSPIGGDLCDYNLILDNSKFIHKSFDDDIKLKDIELITFKSSFYPPMIKKSFDVFRKLVKNNLSDNGEIRVQVQLKNPSPDKTKDSEWPLLVLWREELKKIDKSGLNYKINKEKELLIIRKLKNKLKIDI